MKHCCDMWSRLVQLQTPRYDIWALVGQHLKWKSRGRRGRDRMVVGFTTTCAIRAYHH